MENNHNAKLGSGGGTGAKPITDINDAVDHVENPNLNCSDEPQEDDSAAGSLDMAQSPPAAAAAATAAAAARSSSRTPFTNLSQVDADLALARTLQEQVKLRTQSQRNMEDAWEEVDPDELSYEELLALGEVVGTESRGLSADTLASLPTVKYKIGGNQNGSNDSCVICRLDYEDDETLTLLSCKHSYHPECINNWLNINKVCPVCSVEVSTSGNS
ncbi:43kDa postsynaptic protein [Trema orientale]|uniref:43kDa postsynaptic protein n=1 Tax=Trema orientale TaxID=63057 RepID=A0A2P5G0F2_TREOI|nr:43kDa postsynaptic protein [Trema orientale]